MRARCFSMKSATCLLPRRPSCCARCRIRKSSASARSSRAKSTCVSSRPRTETCARRRRPAVSRGPVLPPRHGRNPVLRLAERKEDLPLLKRHFARSFPRSTARTIQALTPARNPARAPFLAGQRAGAGERHRPREHDGGKATNIDVGDLPPSLLEEPSDHLHQRKLRTAARPAVHESGKTLRWPSTNASW